MSLLKCVGSSRIPAAIIAASMLTAGAIATTAHAEDSGLGLSVTSNGLVKEDKSGFRSGDDDRVVASPRHIESVELKTETQRGKSGVKVTLSSGQTLGAVTEDAEAAESLAREITNLMASN